MAVTEAFINSLAGGSDVGSGEQVPDAGSGDSPGDSATGSGGGSGSTQSVAQVPGAASDNRPGEGSPSAGVPGVGNPDNKGGDQVANLNAAIRETRAENKTLKQQLAELSNKLESLSKPGEVKAPLEPEQEPDFLADPKAYVDAKVQAALKKLEATEKKTEETEQQTKQREAREQVWSATVQAEQQFVATTPDYPEALQYFRAVRTQQLQMMFPDAQPEQIQQHIGLEEMNAAAALIQQNKNPAEFAYNYAKTIGYKPKAPNTTQQTVAKPDKDAVRTMGSGGGGESLGGSEPEGALGILEAAQSEHRAQFKKRK